MLSQGKKKNKKKTKSSKREMENMAQERATKQFYFVSGALWTLLLQFTYSYHMHMPSCVCLYVCVCE